MEGTVWMPGWTEEEEEKEEKEKKEEGANCVLLLRFLSPPLLLFT